jgi:hypothetical protein
VIEKNENKYKLSNYAVISKMKKKCPCRSKYRATNRATAIAQQINRMDNKIIPKPKYEPSETYNICKYAHEIFTYLTEHTVFSLQQPTK